MPAGKIDWYIRDLDFPLYLSILLKFSNRYFQEFLTVAAFKTIYLTILIKNQFFD